MSPKLKTRYLKPLNLTKQLSEKSYLDHFDSSEIGSNEVLSKTCMHNYDVKSLDSPTNLKKRFEDQKQVL